MHAPGARPGRALLSGDLLLTLPDGRRAQAWVGGAPDGPLVVVHHGCPDTRRIAMTGHRAAQQVGVRLLSVNRPGYGASDPWPDPDRASHTAAARDLLALLDGLGEPEVACLGMSVGGGYALATAAFAPDRVRAVALVASPGPPAPGGPTDLASVRQGARPEFEAWRDRLVGDGPSDAELAARFRAALPADDAPLLGEDAAAAASAREALARTDGFLADAAVLACPWDVALEDVGVPVSLWYGEHDERQPPALGGELARRLPRARLHVSPTTHLATLATQWEAILADLAQTLR